MGLPRESLGILKKSRGNLPKNLLGKALPRWRFSRKARSGGRSSTTQCTVVRFSTNIFIGYSGYQVVLQHRVCASVAHCFQSTLPESYNVNLTATQKTCLAMAHKMLCNESNNGVCGMFAQLKKLVQVLDSCQCEEYWISAHILVNKLSCNRISKLEQRKPYGIRILCMATRMLVNMHRVLGHNLHGFLSRRSRNFDCVWSMFAQSKKNVQVLDS